MDAMAKFDLSARVYIHAAGQTFPKTTVCDRSANPAVNPCCSSTSTANVSPAEEIDEIGQSPEFEKHRAELRSQGHDRD
jgi:hypothetical protein